MLTADANGLAALGKPAGVLSHPNEPKDRPRSLLTVHYDAVEECYRWNADGAAEPSCLWLLNRLDSATSGVILVAKDRILAKEVRAQFAAEMAPEGTRIGEQGHVHRCAPEPSDHARTPFNSRRLRAAANCPSSRPTSARATAMPRGVSR